MLLYIKRAPPKVPKTRSRAGCEHCRIKKKKCDEARPDCTRCKDLGQECIYGQPRPRVRRGSTLLPPVDLGMDHPLSVLPVRQMSPSPHCTPAPLPSLPAAPVEGPSSSIDDGHELSAAAGGGGELLFPIHADDEVLFADILDDESFQIPLPLPPQEEEEEEDLVQAATSPSRTTTMSSSSSSSSSSSRVLAKRASLPPSPRRNSMAFYATPHLELNMPLFSEYTNIKGRRALLDHFANVISHLIVLREDQGDNPFQQLVLPMSRQSPAVASAIYALSSAHLEFRGVGGGGGSWEQRKSILFHTEAARNLANLIEKGAQGNQNELLAAVMLLIYYEVLVHRERSHIVTVHLKGAMAILNSAPGISDPTRAFLERAFRFYDVIAALSFRSATLSDAPVSGCVGPFLPVDSRGASRPLGSADALLGMATSLWPIVHRLSNLGALKDELIAAEKAGDDNAPLLRAELKTAAVAIEASLTAWEPEFPLDQDNGTGTGGGYEMTGAFRGILHNALAYRHSALVHLYRSIYGAKRQHPMVQEHTRASLKFCLGTVDSAGPMGALLWPLFVAACEAQAGPDRETATMAFRGIERHQGMANIAHSWMIVEEVWRRADEADTLDQFLVADSDEEGDGDGGSGGSIVLGNRSRTDR